ncbi:MAG TPA: phage tail tip lysozyme [Trebonia sp.]
MSAGSRLNGTRYTPRHASPRSKTARWAGKAAPAAAIAATLAAGVAAYTMATSQPADGDVNTALAVPAGLDHAAHASPAAAAARRAPASPSPARSAPAASASARPAPATARPAVTARPAPKATGVTCSGAGSLLPDNVTAIVNFMLDNGYSRNAAAGIAGNIYQESKGDPESVGSGGGGLIGWTPLPSGFVTGDPAADLRTQLPAILTYNKGWSGYLPALNSAATPAGAADIYVSDFERAGIPVTGTREASASAVASACGL